jgi:hypothetical protein
MAKWVVQIDDPARLPELSRAFHVATSGRPGGGGGPARGHADRSRHVADACPTK